MNLPKRINYSKDFFWLKDVKDIEVSPSALEKTTNISLLGDTNRRIFCEKVIKLCFIMLHSANEIFPNLNIKALYFNKKTGVLHWHPGSVKFKLNASTQLGISNLLKSIYLDKVDENLAVKGLFLNKRKEQEVFDRLVRLHLRSHTKGAIKHDYKSECFNLLRSSVYMLMNGLVPSSDFLKFSTLLLNLHLILMRSRLDIDFEPIVRESIKPLKRDLLL